MHAARDACKSRGNAYAYASEILTAVEHVGSDAISMTGIAVIFHNGNAKRYCILRGFVIDFTAWMTDLFPDPRGHAGWRGVGVSPACCPSELRDLDSLRSCGWSCPCLFVLTMRGVAWKKKKRGDGREASWDDWICPSR